MQEREELCKRQRRCVMLQIKCANLGYDCSWTYREGSEYVLLDVVGMHLRECHGVHEVDLGLLGKIRTSFTYPTAGDAAEKADIIMRKYNCEGDPECSERFKIAMEDLIENKQPEERKAA
jgi:predicted small metal-binding protein